MTEDRGGRALALALVACALSLLGWWDSRRQLSRLRASVEGLTGKIGEVPPSPATGPEHDWLKGTVNEKLKQLRLHTGGFPRAMAEVGYRYTELYFAGKEGNWPVAERHAKMIDEVVRQGIERRPHRAASARYFLEEDFPAFREVLKRKNPAEVEAAFAKLRMACNRCHIREKETTYVVKMPEKRLSPIRKND
ncbi:MAG: hypothetical protein HY078_14215 [Elusimicrobia bacterium]|nr:hypothetical protein [Elusimicrobiota bacterium]